MFARCFLPAFLDEFLHICDINQSCDWHEHVRNCEKR